MTGWSWVLYLTLVVLAGAYSLWVYLRREPRGPGRLLLVGLRAAALATILALVFDPVFPMGPAGATAHVPRLLVDASASMGLPASPGGGTTRWSQALREVRQRGGGQVLLFGDHVRALSGDSLAAVSPGDTRSMVLPALRAAAEAGADRLTVITDAALEGTSGLPGWLARLGLGVDWIMVGERLGGLSLPEVRSPAWVASGDTVDLEITTAADSPVRDSTRLLVRQGDHTLFDRVVSAPPAGRSERIQARIRPVVAGEGDYAILEVALEPHDDLPADDRRFVSIYVSASPAGVTMISLQPDQEPRFLLPVLARALGVPTRGFLRAGSGWLRMGGGQHAGEPVADSEVEHAAQTAQLLVLQGGGSGLPNWLESELPSRKPMLLLGSVPPPADLPLRMEPEQPADWFVQREVPPSPVAALLAGDVPADLPPLSALHPATQPVGSWAPLLARRGRSGETAPLLLAGESGGRRWVVALGDGYWQWAFQGAEGRALYDRLWSAVGGWLLAASGAIQAGPQPVSRVMTRGQPSRWVTAGTPVDSIHLQVTGDGVALDTVLHSQGGDTLEAPVLPPGTYRYRAMAFAGDRRPLGEGELAVETWSPELSRPRVNLAGITAAGRVAGRTVGAGGRPLHTFAWPYVLLVLLLSAEWILRRRWGLR